VFRPFINVATRVAALSVLAAACVMPGCTRDTVPFDAARASSHIDALARRIGSRPIGTPENRQAREYVAAALRDAGFAVRLQEADASDPRDGLTAHVVNVIATKDGPVRDAVALVSHYDSVPDGPGAGDDALGVATCLESGRVLAGLGLRHSLFVIVTDGEEVGLMGARAAVADADVAARVRTFLNFDGTGTAGPTLLFETGPGWGAPLSAWAKSAPAPTGASFGAEIYKRLPNDTDFTVFKTIGASGLNFAPVADSYAYHTDRDVAPRVEAGTLNHEIANTIGTVRALDAMEWTRSDETPTFFDVFATRATVYGEMAGRVLVGSALAVAALAWVVVARDLWRLRGILGLALTALWAIVTSGVSVAAAIGAAGALRSLRTELNPWYASPHWFFLLLIAAGLLAGWAMHWIGWRVSARWQPERSPAGVWWVTLPIWAALAILFDRAAPVAAYLFAWPLLLAGLLVILCRRSTSGMAVGSLIVLVAAVALWARNTWILLRFMVPLFGWLPVTAPVWVYPALMSVAALVIAPPAIALVWQRLSRALVSRPTGLAIAGAALALGGLAWASPAYTALRPQMRTVRYVQDNVSQRAWWEVGGSEPSPGLGVPGPVGAAWQPSADALPASVRVGRLGAPFTFRTTSGPLLAASPADVASETARAADGTTSLDVTIVPRVPLVFRLSLPPGLRPSTSSVTGIVERDVWQATYVAPPAGGVIVHLVFDRRSPTDLRGTTLLFVTSGVPGDPPGAWPAWLPRERDAWHARTMVIDPVY